MYDRAKKGLQAHVGPGGPHSELRGFYFVESLDDVEQRGDLLFTLGLA